MDNKSKLDIHASLCDQLKEVYKTKNADYGDSFASVRNKIGNTAILVRLMDKQSRLETLLLGSHQHVKDESIDDTLMDLANYCLLELTERIAEKQEQKKERERIIKREVILTEHESMIHENNPAITKPQLFIRSGYEPHEPHEPDQRE